MAGRSSTPLKTPGQSFPWPPQPSVTPPAVHPACQPTELRWGQPRERHSLLKGPANYPQLLLIARRCSAQRAPPSSCGEGSGRLGCWFTVCRMQRGCSGLIAEVMVYLFLIRCLRGGWNSGLSFGTGFCVGSGAFLFVFVLLGGC